MEMSNQIQATSSMNQNIEIIRSHKLKSSIEGSPRLIEPHGPMVVLSGNSVPTPGQRGLTRDG
jgi:hypothetical protein